MMLNRFLRAKILDFIFCFVSILIVAVTCTENVEIETFIQMNTKRQAAASKQKATAAAQMMNKTKEIRSSNFSIAQSKRRKKKKHWKVNVLTMNINGHIFALSLSSAIPNNAGNRFAKKKDYDEKETAMSR